MSGCQRAGERRVGERFEIAAGPARALALLTEQLGVRGAAPRLAAPLPPPWLVAVARVSAVIAALARGGSLYALLRRALALGCGLARPLGRRPALAGALSAMDAPLPALRTYRDLRSGIRLAQRLAAR